VCVTGLFLYPIKNLAELRGLDQSEMDGSLLKFPEPYRKLDTPVISSISPFSFTVSKVADECAYIIKYQLESFITIQAHTELLQAELAVSVNQDPVIFPGKWTSGLLTTYEYSATVSDLTTGDEILHSFEFRSSIPGQLYRTTVSSFTASCASTSAWPDTIEIASLTDGQSTVITNSVSNSLNGYTCMSADLNQDTYMDVLDGVYAFGVDETGAAFVYYGSSKISSVSSLSVSELTDGTTGIAIYGTGLRDHVGHALAVGDVNGDGISDLVLGLPGHGYTESTGLSTQFGAVCVLKTHTITTLLETQLTGSNGFTITGTIESENKFGSSVAVGDVDNDGVTDIIIGSPWSDTTTATDAGCIFVVFGSKTLADTMDIATLFSNEQAYMISGTVTMGWLGRSVKTGDINGDGIPDIIMGAPGPAVTDAVHVVYGKNRADWTKNITLTDLSSTEGFHLFGEAGTGRSLAIGDFNGDTFQDFVVGVPGAESGAGGAYIIFGGESIVPSGTVTADELKAGSTAGVAFMCSDANGNMGVSVASGDLNGDGIQDIIVGAASDKNVEGQGASKVYVLYGSQSLGETSVYYTEKLDGVIGFTVTGSNQLGTCVDAGDINKDGYDDLIVGEPYYNIDAGRLWVLYNGKF